MNLDCARAVANATVYEGYVLYPYRASAQKNRSRWQFGVVMPAGYAAGEPHESAVAQTECVLGYDPGAAIEIAVRFLQVQRRTVQVCLGPDVFTTVAELFVDQTRITAWDESVEQEVVVRTTVDCALDGGYRCPVRVQAGEEIELIHDQAGAVVGRMVRRRRPLTGEIDVTAVGLTDGRPACRLQVRISNTTTVDPPPTDREGALASALVAVHTVLGVDSGAFVSMVDPPAWAVDAVAECTNIGCWPVLAGPQGAHDVVLASPIILPDHPEVAPESAGDLYDATEIDEILALRTRALTDEEKREARATDPRAAAVIDRVDALDGADFGRMHGAIRQLRGVASLGPGDVVRLQPGARRSDAQDMFLIGRLATVEAVLRDLDDNPYLAVTLLDDPFADVHRASGRFLYFSPDEVVAAVRP